MLHLERADVNRSGPGGQENGGQLWMDKLISVIQIGSDRAKNATSLDPLLQNLLMAINPVPLSSPLKHLVQLTETIRKRAKAFKCQL